MWSGQVSRSINYLGTEGIEQHWNDLLLPGLRAACMNLVVSAADIVPYHARLMIKHLSGVSVHLD
jgi:hypothetical protein